MPTSPLQRLVPQASKTLCNILEPAQGPLDAPLRSEIFGLQRFAQHGRSLGLTHRSTRSTRNAATFTPRLHANMVRLRRAYEYIGAQANAGYDISPAAEWLLENFHLLEAQFKEVDEGLPLGYFRELPVLVEPPLAGLPRVYGIAWAFVAHTDGAFDEELLVHFLIAYQESCELNLSELWALPTTLRVVLMESLRRLADRVAANKAARELANICSDHLGSYSLNDLDQLLALLKVRGVAQVFLAQMSQRMQDRPPATGENHPGWVYAALPDFAAIQTQLRADQAADNLSVSNAVTSLRSIGDADWPEIVSRTSVLMRLLLASPVFAAEHARTRDTTLHSIELLARRSTQSEKCIAQVLLGLVADGAPSDPAHSVPSYWLEGAGRAALDKAVGLAPPRWWDPRRGSPVSPLGLYLGVMGLATALALGWLLSGHSPHDSAHIAPLWLKFLGALLLLIPVSEAVLAMTNRLVSESTRPQHLHRLAFADGIPACHRVMVAMPCMLIHPAGIANLAHRLHLHFLANPETHAQMALLSDWADADTEHTATDAALLETARLAICALNTLHPLPGATALDAPRFLLLHRKRSYSDSEQGWIGWERKRGKLEVLIDTLATGKDLHFAPLGSASRIATGTRYVVTLDSDTQLPAGRLRDLVGIAAHPYNQPRMAPDGLRVASGYGILQPRIVTPLPSQRTRTRFHWLFAGQPGIDPYSAASSEVYQDLFSEGTFTGKGLLHVQAMHQVLSARLPEGQVLSHDLLEGALARCAAVSDITVVEDVPFHSDVAASRIHRWTRGDWQLLPFLWQASRHGITGIHRWKMLDNLRRSLVAPALLAVMVAALEGWLLPVPAALAVVLLAYTTGPLIGALAGFFPSRRNLAGWHFYVQALLELHRTLWAGVWHLAQLGQNALLSLDAIVRALYRTRVSRRHLLQWTTAESAHASALVALPRLLRLHFLEPLLAGLLAIFLLWTSPFPLTGLLLCLLWGAGPVWTWLASRPIHPQRESPMTPVQRLYLAGVARDTWRFFERTVVAAENHLPPDNLQITPFDMVAHRTSPTNIGMYLLSVACARDSGWIGTQEFMERIESTLCTLDRLSTHQGHLLNWYDTQTCLPLLPMYVSTVDSGNLSGHLLSVAQACKLWSGRPDNLVAVRQSVQAAEERLRALLHQRSTLPAPQREEIRWLVADVRANRQSLTREMQACDGASAAHTAQRLLALTQRLEILAWRPDFRFLFHAKRHLFHIGFRVAEQQLDASFYDLLASEARLTSLLAIAKGDVPVSHWSALGRMFYALGARAGLRSWSGSMFEYLMPALVLEEPQDSVLREASCVAIAEHIDYCRSLEVPWGISESAYAGRDHTLAYQYAPQGVPRLALRRTPANELVIAPYATALALQLMPEAGYHNLQALQALGARKRYGFIEALDFSPARQAGSGPFTAVETFMAHHQGMTVAALTNVLRGGSVRRWGMANAHIEAIASLLHERTPREVSRLYRLPSSTLPQMLRQRQPGLLRQVVPGAQAIAPTHVLSNGRYQVTLRPNGAGSSNWGHIALTRRRDDGLRDAYGTFQYLALAVESPHTSGIALHSLTQHPAPDPQATYQSTFHADRVCLQAQWPLLQTQTTVWVSPEDDIEFRETEVRNLSAQAIELDIFSTFEVALSDPRADESHPAFANMFVRAAWQNEHQALIFERRPRLPADPSVFAAHFLACSDSCAGLLRICTTRQLWQGRNQDASHVWLHEHAFTKADGTLLKPSDLPTGLDPVAIIGVRLRIPAHAKTSLTFASAAAANGETLHAVLDKYRQPSHIQRSSLMSATLAEIRLRALHISADSFAAMQTLTTALLLHLPHTSGDAVRTDGVPCDRRLLWRFGISGDRPILLVSVGVMQGLGLLRSLGQALRFWSWSGLACTVVVMNSESSSYLMGLQREIAALCEKVAQDCAGTTEMTRMHVLRLDDLSADEVNTLQVLARLHIHADGRPLQHPVQEWVDRHESARETRRLTPRRLVGPGRVYTPPGPPPAGEFGTDGAFEFSVSHAHRPLRPWTQVLANPGFGALQTESGGGYTWSVNSRLNQLTPWSNDAVADPPGEWFLLHDIRSGAVWSAAPSAWGAADVQYRVTHQPGMTSMTHTRFGLKTTVTWCVDPVLAVKQITLHLENTGTRDISLRAIALMEWIVGAARSDRSTTSTAHQRGPLGTGVHTVLSCTQRAREGGLGETSAFLSVSTSSVVMARSLDWTCDRREFFDACGRLVVPDTMGHSCGASSDPCAALALTLDLLAGQGTMLVFTLGCAPVAAQALSLASHVADLDPGERLDAVHAHWQSLLGAVTVSTPDPLLDAMVNHWLLYQTVACRMWAKAGFYQAGGASGFRDQLQDSLALSWAAPRLLRAQIVLCASRQFPEGDVQHWWHAPGGAGVRTHFSDDLLWLAWACNHYLHATGDLALLDETVAFIEGPEIPEGAEDIYNTPVSSIESATVYEHAARAIDRSLRTGAHGLPLMGSGDWNDGMNRVGFLGRGESVWLGWFLCRIVSDFAPRARARQDDARARRWEDAAQGWAAALEHHGWDGQWYRRAFFDDGQMLGSASNAECRIDLIAQAWAVLSDLAPPDRQAQALDAAHRQLVDPDTGLLALLTPPFAASIPSPGYIQAYPAGVRENGGQYNHAGAWAVMAQAQAHRRGLLPLPDQPAHSDLAYRYFTALSCAHQASSPQSGAVYGLEPYAMAGDVYTQAPYAGRGGWSWYTGAAGWMHQAAIASLFGLDQSAETIQLTPCLPQHWNEASITLVRGSIHLHFMLVRADASKAMALAVERGASLLGIAEPLAWTALPKGGRFLVALPPATPA